MKRPTLWLWCSAGLVGVALVVVFGGWWAIRRWPMDIGPHLPLSLAIRLAVMGEQEFKAAHWSFFHRRRPPVSASQISACNAALCQGLRNSRDEQLVVLRLLYTHFEDTPLPATPERDALVFACTTSDDPEVRTLARLRWTEGTYRPHHYLKRHASEFGDNDRSPLSPDRWVTGRAAWIAWRMMVFSSLGYHHLKSSPYTKHLRAQLDLLLACEDGHGRFSADERDQAIVVQALADLLAITNDQGLRPLVERAAAVTGGDRARIEQLWLEDTTTACLTALCSMALTQVDIPADHLREPLHAGFDAWWASRTNTGPPPWFSRGLVVEATVTERWGAAIAGHWWCTGNGTDVASVAPATLLDDLTPCTPFGRWLTMLGAVATANPRWREPHQARQQSLDDTMVITPDHLGLEGSWPAHGNVSADWETVFSALELTLRWPGYPSPP